MQDKTIRVVPHEKCTGCGACYNKCPKNAIKMKLDSEGFLFPEVQDDCVSCGACQGACPVLNPVKLNSSPRCYAVWADQETRKLSSSGGMFSIIARAILAKGGVVFGAVYSDDFSRVEFTYASTEEELQPIRGSKYVQSDVGHAYREVKRFLDQGTPVLFTGCPCQVAGLYTYLGKQYAELYTADIVCHGAPSPEVYRAYLAEKAAGRTLTKVDFREKAYWGWGTATSLFFSDGSQFRKDCFTDPYWKGFLGGVITRKNCGECRYAQINRIGDFTLGDFWGVKNIDAESDDKKGTSLVLVNSAKAREMFDELDSACTLCREEKLSKVTDLARTSNGQLLSPTRSHPNRAKFFDNFGKMPFTQAYEQASGTPKYDIGYVGWWDSKNYGSSLTCFAINRTLKNMGYSVLMLEHPGIQPQERYDSYGIQFAKHFYDISKITKEKDFSRFNAVCDSFVVGSDQVWNWWCNKDIGFGYYFLNFVNKDHRKVAYAPSFGSDWTSYPDHTRIRVSYWLSRFDAVSVREKSGVQICERDFNRKADWVMDPVFLCDIASYEEAVALSKRVETEPYLFAYILDVTEEKFNAVKQAAKAKGLSYRIAIDGLGNKAELNKQLGNDPNIITNLRIEDWLYYIKNASFVIADSFHGFCFSIIFKKQVIAFVNAHRGKARFDTISEAAGLEEYVVESVDDIAKRDLLEKEIDYTQVDANLAPYIEFSRNWLKKALTDRKLMPSVTELQLWKCLEHDQKLYEMRQEIDELKELNRQMKALLENQPQSQDGVNDQSPAQKASNGGWLSNLLGKGK